MFRSIWIIIRAPYTLLLLLSHIITIIITKMHGETHIKVWLYIFHFFATVAEGGQFFGSVYFVRFLFLNCDAHYYT
jgi:hypothetical protein